MVGRARKQSSFVTGDTVNVAARLEQAAEPGEILVGGRAAALVVGAFEFDAPTHVEAKGKAGGVECRRLVRALSLMRPRGVPGLRPAFVGRDDEFGLLRQAYERARTTGEPQAVTIMGEAGVGKTRLLRELWEWCGTEAPDALRRTGRCAPYGPARTYQPLAEIIKEHFGILDSDSPERVLTLLGERKILALALGLDLARAGSIRSRRGTASTTPGSSSSERSPPRSRLPSWLRMSTGRRSHSSSCSSVRCSKFTRRSCCS